MRCPLLVLYGEYDWYETPAGAESVARIMNHGHPGRARFVLVPKTDHHFESFSRPEDAVAGKGGQINDGPAVREIVTWLRTVLGDSSAK